MISKSKLIHMNEDNMLELKTSESKLSESFWETYSSFCNTKGGLVILGVDEKKKGNIITGVKDPEQLKTNLFNDLSNPSKVSFNNITDDDFVIEDVEGESIKVILITIREAPISEKPVHLKNNLYNSYIRTSDGDRKAKLDQVKAMIRDSSSKSMDEEILPTYSIDDLDKDTIMKYRNILAKRDNDQNSKDLDDFQFLINVGVIIKNRQKEDKYEISVAALLFFGKYHSIIDRFPHFHLDYFNKSNIKSERWSDRVASDDSNELEMNIFNFYTIILEKLKLTVENPFELNEQLQTQNVNSLIIALRESLVNCLMHADYYSDRSSIIVEVLDGCYSFTNPGIMKISVEDFINGGNSLPRNLRLTQLFRRAGLSERAGTGGPKIYKVAFEKRFRLPEIETSLDKTILRIWKEDLASSHKNLSENEHIILQYISNNLIPTSFKEIQNSTKLTEYRTRIAIQSLIDQEIIIKDGKARSLKYEVNFNEQQKLSKLHEVFSFVKHTLIK